MSHPRKTLSATAAAALFAFASPMFAAGCVGAIDDPNDPLGHDSENLYMTGSQWPSGWVPVCWASSTVARADFNSFAQRVRNDAENSWMRAARIEFSGWQTCPSNTNGMVVVNLKDTNTADAIVGYYSDHPVVVNLGVQRGDFDTAVIHEFGHVLGFAHEMARPGFTDIPGTGCAEDNVTGGWTLSTDPDPQSIMASTGYCQNNTTLSAWDIVGVQSAYGRKRTGAVVGLNGRCIAVENASTTAGASLIGWPCYQTTTGPKNDVWTFNGAVAMSFQTFLNGTTPRCMNVYGGVTSPYGATPLVSYSCTQPAANENFALNGVQWKGMGNMCVVAPTATQGAQLQIQPCGTMPYERWDVRNGDYRIRLSGSNLCVNVPYGSATIGNVLQLYPCAQTPAANETFLYPPNKGGVIQYGNLCMNVLGGKPTAGAQIGLWDGCVNISGAIPKNEQFSWSGPIRSLGQCVDMLGGASYNGVPLGVYPCQPGAPNEQWDVYW